MNRIRILAAATVTAGVLLILPGTSLAHHTTVICQSPGIWKIVNSENLSMTYTTSAGHTGSIGPNDDGAGPNGETSVAYSGTTLTVSGVWSNSVVNSNTGTGDCTEVTTTTTIEPTTTTVEPTTTTVAETTTTVGTTTTTADPTTTTVEPTTTTVVETTVVETTEPETTIVETTAPTETTTTAVETTIPDTTEPPTVTEPPAPTVPEDTTPPCEDDPSTPTNDCARLPATGADARTMYLGFLAAVCIILGALTIRWNRQ